MYFARASSQLKINIARCWNEHLFMSEGLSGVQCRLSPAMKTVFFGTVSMAWTERAGQLAAGDATSMWTL